MLTHESVTAAMKTVNDPELHRDLVTLNMVKEVRIDGDDVRITVELTTPACPMKETIERDVRAALTKIGASNIDVQFTAQVRAATGGAKREMLPQVKNVIAVGAGKGGVGKSTIAVNLAVALQRDGATVGLLDGDVYGPSVPTLLGVKGMVPQVTTINGVQKIIPLRVHGIYAMTIGLLVEPEKALIWRGPMAQGAFKQLLNDNTVWPELDYLIIDLPPGTGDVPLTMCQMLPINGAVVVATPQQVALDDAIRAVRMFEQLKTPVLGMVENMSYFVASDGTEHDIFGRGGTRNAAKQLNLPCLGEVPMFTQLRVNSDAGKPHANFEGDPRLAEALTTMARAIAGQVSQKNLRRLPVMDLG